MKLAHCLLPYLIGAVFICPSLANAQSDTENTQQPLINMITYEHKAPNQYATVLYMPYYPAYGMISLKSPTCNTEIAGYIDPFALKKNKLIITYKKCKVSFDMTNNNQQLSNPAENTECQKYHSQSCNFTQIPVLKQISLEN